MQITVFLYQKDRVVLETRLQIISKPKVILLFVKFDVIAIENRDSNPINKSVIDHHDKIEHKAVQKHKSSLNKYDQFSSNILLDEQI